MQGDVPIVGPAVFLQHLGMNNSAAIVQCQNAQLPLGNGGSTPTLPLQIREIHQATAKDLISKFHYLGAKAFRCGYAFGLYENGSIIGAIVYHGLSAPETAVGAFGLQRDDQAGLWEIGRLVLIPEKNGGNRGSFLIRRSLMLLRRKACVRACVDFLRRFKIAQRDHLQSRWIHLLRSYSQEVRLCH